MALLNMIRPVRELDVFQREYPWPFIANVSDFNFVFTYIESAVVSPNEQNKFLKEPQYQPLLQSPTGIAKTDKEISRQETFNDQNLQQPNVSKQNKMERPVKQSRPSQKVKKPSVKKESVSNEKTQSLQTSVADLIEQHHKEIKENHRHPFVAWGSIQSRTVVFLGDINLDELNQVYGNASKCALQALTKIVRFQNESGLKYIDKNLFELKTVRSPSGSIRYFGGRAFPSKYKNSKGGTDVFYISLERCPELV